jgi:clusterin-associated protein 1
MDEYEKIEVDLINLYETYMERYRNLTFLEQQLDEYNQGEQDQFEETEESLKKMQDRIRQEELRLLRGNPGAVLDPEEDSNRPKRPTGIVYMFHL